MNQTTTSIIDGYTAFMTELLELLVSKPILTADDIREIAIRVLIRGVEQEAQPGFDAVPMYILNAVDSWTDACESKTAQQPSDFAITSALRGFMNVTRLTCASSPAPPKYPPRSPD